MKSLLLSLVAIFCFDVFLYAQDTFENKSALRIETIMQDPDVFIGSQPSYPQWSLTGERIYFEWNPENKPRPEYFYYSLSGEDIQKLSIQERIKMPSGVKFNQDRSRIIYLSEGNLFTNTPKMDDTLQITSNIRNIRNYNYTAIGNIVIQIGNDLFLWKKSTGMLEQIARFERGFKKSKKTQEEDEAKIWLRNQQNELFETIQTQKTRENYINTQRKLATKSECPVFYDENARVSQIQISPDERFISYSLLEFNRGSKPTEVPHFVTSDGYVYSEKARAKVGTQQPVRSDVFLYDRKRDTLIEPDLSDLPGIKEYPAFFKEYDHKTPNTPRSVLTFGPYWSDNGKHAVLEIRSQDNKDRWIMQMDNTTGDLKLLDRQRDEAWIGGPGIGNYNWGGGITWLKDNKHIAFQSEESGYAHLYLVNIETGDKRQITGGTFEVYNPILSEDGRFWYFTANAEHPGERHFYKMPVGGGRFVKLTDLEGRNDVFLSPDEKHLVIRNSYMNRPWELYLKENRSDAKSIQITHSLNKSFESYDWKIPEIVTFEANDGEQVYGRLYQPKPNNKNGAAVLFVHGAGYLQNAHKWWSNYFREYMFHNILVDNGFTVLDIDYRGSAGYGRDWRTAIYRHMGGRDLQDYVDAKNWLVDEYAIDGNRIGIYGGSYGGFITLMALFNEADDFACGAALRSVTDWAHYNHSYTSNILNTPVLDSIAYKRSSPIYFAEGLEDPLLMCHGMVDSNVQFQDIVRLTQRLIELGKENWELAVYPVEPHSFKEPTSWADEYKRIFKLFNEHLVIH